MPLCTTARKKVPYFLAQSIWQDWASKQTPHDKTYLPLPQFNVVTRIPCTASLDNLPTDDSVEGPCYTGCINLAQNNPWCRKNSSSYVITQLATAALGRVFLSCCLRTSPNVAALQIRGGLTKTQMAYKEMFDAFPPQFSVRVKAEDLNYVFPLPPLLCRR